MSRHNQQLEILAARQRLFNGGFRIDRHRFNDDTHTGGTPHSVKVEQQPVGDVHERRGAGTPCREPLFDTRPRPPVRLDRRRTRPLGEFPGAQIAEPRRRGPEGTGDEDALTGARPRTGQGLGGVVFQRAEHGDARHGHRRARKVTTHNDAAPHPGRRRHAGAQPVEVGVGCHAQAGKQVCRPGTHGSDVTDGGGDRSPAEVLLGEQCQVGMHAGDRNVGCDHQPRVGDANDGGVVPEPQLARRCGTELRRQRNPDSLEGGVLGATSWAVVPGSWFWRPHSPCLALRVPASRRRYAPLACCRRNRT